MYKVRSKRNQISLIILIVIVLTSILIISPAFGTQKGKYITCKVTAGDTLWDIAKENGPDNQDIRKTIFYIKKYNNLSTSYIYPGQILKIPASID